MDEIFNDLLQEAIDNSYNNISGLSMALLSDDLEGGVWTGAKGFDSNAKEDILSASQPFRVASVTKTFVAAAIMRLHEMDSISIEDPITEYISADHIQILEEDGYKPEEILIKHCLNHTSGIADYATTDDYISEALQNPDKRWTRTEQLEWATKYGDPLWPSGSQYRYSDSGYILAGEIIERYSQGDLASGLRSLLKFEKIGLQDTWLETLENHPSEAKEPVHRYLRKLVDATGWDPSVDLYGGGGLMSTTKDLATFMSALFTGLIFDDASTLELMMTPPDFWAEYNPDEDDRYKDYRYGFWEISIYGEKAYKHGGLWGSTMMYVPAYGCSIASNFTYGRNDRMEKKALLAIKKLREQNGL